MEFKIGLQIGVSPRLGGFGTLIIEPIFNPIPGLCVRQSQPGLSRKREVTRISEDGGSHHARSDPFDPPMDSKRTGILSGPGWPAFFPTRHVGRNQRGRDDLRVVHNGNGARHEIGPDGAGPSRVTKIVVHMHDVDRESYTFAEIRRRYGFPFLCGLSKQNRPLR